MAFYDISKVIDGGSMENKKYIIGLDLGINNVGYSVVDEETKKILKKVFGYFHRQMKQKIGELLEILDVD